MSVGNQADRLIDDRVRTGLAKFVELILPGTDALPPGTDVGTHHEWLDRVLDADPRLIPSVIAVGEAAGQVGSCTLPELEAATGATALESAVFALTSAYYIVPAVLEVLQYPGQARRPVAEATQDERYSEELLAPVRARGPIYVPTP